MTNQPADNHHEAISPIPSPSKGLMREFSRRIMRHSVVLAFTAGILILFVIEAALPFWLALVGMALITTSALIYAGPLTAIDPRRWRTERRHAMRRDAANLLPNPILLTDVSGNIRLANQAARALFAREDLHGLHISSLVRDPDFLSAFAKAQKKESAHHVHWHIHVPVERYFHVHIAAALMTRRGITPFMLISFDEQTDMRLADQMRRDFIANASHELKTPLTVFTGYLETLRDMDSKDEAQRQKFIDVMEQQSQLMVQLVDDLLSLSRIEQQEHRPPDQQIDLIAVIRESINLNKEAAQKNGVNIKTEIIPDKAPSQGDAKELVQALNNLINNAISHGANSHRAGSHGAAGNKIEITLAEDRLAGRPAWRIAVRDFGIGIASHHTPRLTERFYRVNPEESRKLGGTGLGLAIVKHILTRHRGQLRIHSREGEGATFTALLPQNPDQQP